jgi:hypothetical protein
LQVKKGGGNKPPPITPTMSGKDSVLTEVEAMEVFLKEAGK